MALTTPAPQAFNCSSEGGVGGSLLAQHDPGLLAYYVGSLVAVALTNVTGNCLVLATFRRHRCLWLPPNAFVCSLALSDCLFGFVYPLYNLAGMYLPGYSQFFGQWSVCSVTQMEVLALEVCSAYNLVAITVSRYITTVFPLRWNRYMTSRNCIIVVIALWTSSHTICLLLYVVRTPDAVITGQYCGQCRFELLYTQQELVWFVVMQFGVPFVIMVTVYVKMACIARKLNNRVTTLELSCSNSRINEPPRLFQRRHKPIAVISLLIGCFTVSYVPMLVYLSVMIIEGPTKPEYDYLNVTARMCLFSNTAVNVFIYAGRMPDFKVFCRRDLACLFKRRQFRLSSLESPS